MPLSAAQAVFRLGNIKFMQDMVPVHHGGVDADAGVPVQAIFQVEGQLIAPGPARQLHFRAQGVGQLLGIAVVVRIAVIPGGGIAAFDGGHHLVLAVQDGKAAFQIEGAAKPRFCRDMAT